jgi:hypothetical protein
MVEYGYRYRDPEIGIFYSRFTLKELRELDAQQGQASAAILDAYRGRYPEFLERYSPAVNPFVHEARVHLFRRDRFLEKLRGAGGDEAKEKDFSSVAYSENRILEKYFPITLAASAYVLPADQAVRLADRRDLERLYVSSVSQHLITWPGEPGVRLGILGMIVALAVTSRRLSR